MKVLGKILDIIAWAILIVMAVGLFISMILLIIFMRVSVQEYAIIIGLALFVCWRLWKYIG